MGSVSGVAISSGELDRVELVEKLLDATLREEKQTHINAFRRSVGAWLSLYLSLYLPIVDLMKVVEEYLLQYERQIMQLRMDCGKFVICVDGDCDYHMLCFCIEMDHKIAKPYQKRDNRTCSYIRIEEMIRLSVSCDPRFPNLMTFGRNNQVLKTLDYACKFRDLQFLVVWTDKSVLIVVLAPTGLLLTHSFPKTCGIKKVCWKLAVPGMFVRHLSLLDLHPF